MLPYTVAVLTYLSFIHVAWCGIFSTVTEIDGFESFAKTVLSSDTVWGVLFYGSDAQSDALTGVVEQAAVRANGLAPFAAINMAEQDWPKQMLSGEAKPPFILIFPSRHSAGIGAGPPQPFPYQGAPDPEAIAKAVAKLLPAVNILQIKEGKHLENFMKMNSSYAKALLFSDKDKPSAVYKAISLNFMDRMLFAEVRCNLEAGKAIASSHGVEKMPTLRIYPGDGSIQERDRTTLTFTAEEGKEGEAPGTGVTDIKQFENYEGSLKVKDIASVLDTYAFSEELRDAEAKRREEEKQTSKEKATTGDKKPKAKDKIPQASRIWNAELWVKGVIDHGGIHAVAFLDPSQENHKQNVGMLHKLVHKISLHGGTKANTYWVDGTKQPEVAKFFKVNNDYPNLVFINSKKGWFKNFIGSFSVSSAWKFLSDSLLRGEGRPFDIEKAPSFVDESNEDLQELTEDEIEDIVFPKKKAQREEKERKEKQRKEEKERKEKAEKEKNKPKQKTAKQLELEEKREAREKARAEEVARKAEERLKQREIRDAERLKEKEEREAKRAKRTKQAEKRTKKLMEKAGLNTDTTEQPDASEPERSKGDKKKKKKSLEDILKESGASPNKDEKKASDRKTDKKAEKETKKKEEKPKEKPKKTSEKGKSKQEPSGKSQKESNDNDTAKDNESNKEEKKSKKEKDAEAKRKKEEEEFKKKLEDEKKRWEYEDMIRKRHEEKEKEIRRKQEKEERKLRKQQDAAFKPLEEAYERMDGEYVMVRDDL